MHVQMHPLVRYYGHNWYYRIDKKTEAESPVRVLDVLAHERSQWRLKYHLVSDTLMLTEFHPSYAQQYSQLALANGLMLNQMGHVRFTIAACCTPSWPATTWCHPPTSS